MPDFRNRAYDRMHDNASAAPSLRFSGSTAGFTLIEIAVVMAIIAMVMMLVIPRLPSSDSENLKISARTLASTLRYLQERATVGSVVYFLHLEPGTEVILVREGAADSSEKEPADPLLKKRPVKAGIQVADVVIPRLGKISEGPLRIEVGAGGLRDLLVIHLRAPDNNFWTVMAFPDGGKVKVYPGYQEDAR